MEAFDKIAKIIKSDESGYGHAENNERNRISLKKAKEEIGKILLTYSP